MLATKSKALRFLVHSNYLFMLISELKDAVEIGDTAFRNFVSACSSVKHIRVTACSNISQVCLQQVVEGNVVHWYLFCRFSC